MVMKYAQLYSELRRSLLPVEEAREAGFLARTIIAHFAGITQEQLLANSEMYTSDDVCEACTSAVNRLIAGEPLAYIIGEWEFYGLKLAVTPDVLIPRDDTCAVATLAIQQCLFLDKSPRILDLCTGSGCIGLAIASRVPDSRVTLGDISKAALSVAKQNIQRNHLTGRVSTITVDALSTPSAFLGKFDLIVSNPPYITTQEMRELPDSVANFEPHLALHGGDDGLIFYRNITEKYKVALKPGGYLCFEFGMGQGNAVCEILENNGYTILERSRDYNDRERAVLAQLNRKD